MCPDCCQLFSYDLYFWWRWKIVLWSSDFDAVQDYSEKTMAAYIAETSLCGVHGVCDLYGPECLVHTVRTSESVAYRWGGWGFKPPPPEIPKALQIVTNSTRLWKLLKNAEFRTPTYHDVRKKGSKILKLLPVRNCFTLAITNKFVVIINSLKVPKIKKILLYEMKFLVLNYSCLQNTWLGGYCPQIPVLFFLCPQLNLLNPPTPKKIPGYATGQENSV